MKIYVNQIPYEGVRKEASYDPKMLDMERFDIHLETPIALSSFITKADEELIVKAEIACVLDLHCARCLVPFERPLHTEAMLSYEVSPTDIVDITDDVRQEVMLAYPMIPICREDCQGLCATCGQNLNVARCAHQPS